MELPKAYNPKGAEEKTYKLWEESGYFNPDKLPKRHKEPYTIIMPPPNANAPLHVGHALGVTIQDILTRYHRMRGYKTLYLPGTDHAGFETQVVFEKYLEKQGKSRFQMTREEFYKECWDFVQTNKHLSEGGLKRLGASCDWSRNIFTLDPEVIKIVYETFEQMHKDGLVYRAGRISNWCPKHQTGLADLETKHEERTEPFYYFKYGPFVIGTSRPETKFGDKYVVMHPDDKRYEEYEDGQKINLEWINGPVEATVIKDRAVDMTFGTGAMTITPAHDPIDFEIAQRHELDVEKVIDLRDKLLPIAGEFSGMKILEARPKIVEKLKEKGLLEKIDEDYKHSVKLCYKCSSLIEPQIINQWYVKMTEKLKDGRPSLRDLAVRAVESREINFHSDRFENLFMSWMKELRDWPISRQIWWGIPIPVKYCDKCGEIYIDKENKIKNCSKCKSELRNEPDTFDTWFSSGQWPYATMMANDAKNGTNDLKTYFPIQVMETGWDIIFFWVARMIMLSFYKTGKKPFENVLLHGLVRDKDRQKMSKSKGNVVDPLGVIDTYGTDALRFALVFSTAAGNDIPLSEDKIRGMQHFANKLWNISRFVLANLPESYTSQKPVEDMTSGTVYPNFLKDLEDLIESVTIDIELMRLHEAAQKIYQFTWHEFADKFIEKAKPHLKDENIQHILFHTLTQILKLLHPFMPFITEEIYQRLLPILYPTKSDLQNRGSSISKPNQNDLEEIGTINPPADGKKLLLVEEWPSIK
ncbi:MAG: valine--tRNA ligase [bacterium]|nr:valine--tRNA ligase [bacterium]